MSRLARTVATAAGAVLLALGGSACGGGERQDSGEPAGRYDVAVTKASFPLRQRLSRLESLMLTVRNTGPKALPDVAVTVDGFSARSEQAGMADPQQPVWILGDAPAGGTTATATTWALGRLEPGDERTFTWRVSPVLAGTHRVHWRVAAGLGGRAEAVLAGNRTPEGDFTVVVSGRPSASRVDPDTGQVVRTGD